LIAVATFLPSLNNGYVVNWDDSYYVLGNKLIRGLTFDSPRKIFT